MTHEEAVRILDEQDVAEWNRRRDEPWGSLRDLDFRGDLPGIDLSGLRILGASFIEADLTGSNCRGAVLYGSHFGGAVLRGSCFAGADLRHCVFGCFSIGLGHCSRMADLSGSDFSDARLYGADLSETIVEGANFRRADMRKSSLGQTDFSQADLMDALTEGVYVYKPPEPPAPIHFGEWLKAHREKSGLTPDELAAALGLGLTGYDVATFMERKAAGVAGELAKRLSKILGVPLSEIPRP